MKQLGFVLIVMRNKIQKKANYFELKLILFPLLKYKGIEVNLANDEKI